MRQVSCTVYVAMFGNGGANSDEDNGRRHDGENEKRHDDKHKQHRRANGWMFIDSAPGDGRASGQEKPHSLPIPMKFLLRGRR